MKDTPPPAGDGVTIVYDGQCPVCSAYVRMTRLQAAAGPVRLVDARQDHPIVAEARAAGLDLDSGMVVKLDGQLHHGARAMTVLAGMTTRSGLFNRAVRAAFAHPGTARLFYPPLTLGRRILLRLLGRTPL